MQIFAGDFVPISGANVGRVGRVGQVGQVGRSAVAGRTPGGSCVVRRSTDVYGFVRSCRGFCPASTFARGYGGQAIGWRHFRGWWVFFLAARKLFCIKNR